MKVKATIEVEFELKPEITPSPDAPRRPEITAHAALRRGLVKLRRGIEGGMASGAMPGTVKAEIAKQEIVP